MTLEELSRQIANLDGKIETLDKKMDDGFNASKVRDEELLGLGKLSLEANEILREEIGRRAFL